MNGRNGRDVYVRVPCGVVVRRVLDWEEMEDMIMDAEEEEEEGESDVVDESSVEGTASSECKAADQLRHEKDEHMEISSYELDDDEQEGDVDGEYEHINEDDEEDFDTQYESLQSSKRHRKRNRRQDGLPSDYDEVVDQGVRSEDGFYYWSPPP